MLRSDNDDCEWDMMRENDELLRNTCDKSMIVKEVLPCALSHTREIIACAGCVVQLW